MGRPVVGAVIGAALLVGALGGCGAFPVACPAVGWLNTVEVRVPGWDRVDPLVHEVAFCGGVDCTPGATPTQVPAVPGGATPTATATPAVPAVPAPDGGLTSGPEPTDPVDFPTPGRTTVHDGDTWSVLTETGTPGHGRVALFDETGGTIRERAVTLTWERTGGSEQCGGPGTARTTVRP